MKINSLYTSVSGEVSSIPQGAFTTILRLAGCNLNCSWPCDAPEARDGVGEEQTVDTLFETIDYFGNKNILITGGEPLLQRQEVGELLFKLLVKSSKEIKIAIETNGTLNPREPKNDDNGVLSTSLVTYVVDYKMPSSGHYLDMNIENFLSLKRNDFIKFVCDDADDIEAAIEVSKILLHLNCKAQMAIGQTWDWYLKKNFNLFNYLMSREIKYFILNFQLHKMLSVD